MQEYANVVINALPLMLNVETKGKGAVTIASYMNAILRKVKTEEDLLIFAQVLEQCKEFSAKNNLGGLNRTCSEWNHEGILKLNQIRGLNNQQSMNNGNLEAVQRMQQFLSQTRAKINKTGTIDADDYQIVSSQLDQIEASLMVTGKQYLTDEQIQSFLNEINYQREQIRINYAMIDDILESSGMTR